MKKSTKALSIILIFSMVFPLSLLAHSGRTDSAGGHRDNKNVSGLGSYHYHHGYGPHLHPGGVCPYETASTVNSTTPTQPAPIPKPAEPAPVPAAKPSAPVVTTSSYPSIIVQVDGRTLNDKGLLIEGKTYVPLREAMEAVGCSISWQSSSNTASITSSREQSATPIQVSSAISDRVIYLRHAYQLLTYAGIKAGLMDIGISNDNWTEEVDISFEEYLSQAISTLPGSASINASGYSDLTAHLLNIYQYLHQMKDKYTLAKSTYESGYGYEYFDLSAKFWDVHSKAMQRLDDMTIEIS